LVFWKHSLVQDTGHKNASRFFTVENNMSADSYASQAWPDLIRGSTVARLVSQLATALFELVEIAVTLSPAPSPIRIKTDV
jgi:hypothetical protein